MSKNFFRRTVALLLILCSILGIMPTGILTVAQAADGSTLINSINDLDAPVSVTNSLKTVTSTNNGELAGTYYIVNHYSDGKKYAIDPLPEASVGRLKATQVTVSNNSVTDGDLSMAIDVEYVSDNVYWLYVSDGRYIREQDISKTASIVLGERSLAIGLQLKNGAIRMYRRFSVGTTNDAHNMTNNGTEIYFVKDTGSYTATNTFYFYQITQRWDTSALYSAIMEMASYLSAENTAYAQGIYDKFLSCMEASVTLYKKHNVATDSQTYAQVLEIRKELEAQTQWLLSYKAVLQGDYGTAAEKIPVPNNEMVPFSYGEFQKYQLSNLAEDTYYLVNLLGDGSRGRAVNTGSNFFQSGVGYFHAADVTVENNKLTNADPDWAVYLDVYPDSTNLCIPRPVHNVDITLNGLGEDGISYKFSSGTGQDFNSEADYNAIYLAIHVYDLDGDGDKYNDWSFLTYLPELGGYRPYRNPDHSHTEDNSLTLFRLSTQSVELYKAIRDSARFAAEDADSRYPQSVYEQFLQCLSESIGLYLQYNVDLTGAQEANFSAIKNEMDKKAGELRDYARIMTSADELTEYIDIPVEVLDFRADAHLFEYINGYYGLSGAPGTSSNHGKLDLTEGTLNENRQIAYREAVVDYVVKAFTEASLEGSDLSDKVPGWNDAIYKLMPSVAGDQKLPTGSYDETIKKTTTGANGGDLRWSQVTTYYDLAYYMLTYMWRPVQSGDIMDKTDNLPYNTTVTQRDRLRLYANEKGDYILDSASELVYDGYYIYNSVPRIDTDVELNSPYFQPINGLGFETEEMRKLLGGDTDRGTYFYENGSYVTENTNFHFTLHAYGSFVYYEDQNLYFDFLGDDDVYFFIDGKMALDIGGAHAALGAGIELNDLKASHGLIDGEIYTFDMFYAERHTTAANLKFSTNIKIVDTDTITTMGQYARNLHGESVESQNYGLGAELMDNAPLAVGDLTAYSLELLNTREVPVFDLHFNSPALGTNISPNSVTLYKEALTNGAKTLLSDLRIIYHSATKDETTKIDDSAPVSKTVSQITSLLREHIQNNTPLDSGSYVVTISTEKELMDLLALGIPQGCQICIYGFRRYMGENDTPFTNTLKTVCSYQRSQGGETMYISGIASRILRVISDLPKVTGQQLVLDYGKAVEIPVKEYAYNIQTDAFVSVTGFVGVLLSGENNAFLKSHPAGLLCAKPDDTAQGKQGSFRRTETTLIYEPGKFLEEVETVYLVYAIQGCETADKSGRISEYPYVLMELQLIPGTSVYYESDFAQGVFDISGNQKYLLFDFNGTDKDMDRYQGTAYGFYNFDSEEEGHWATRSTRTDRSVASDYVIDNEAGTMTVNVASGRPYNDTMNYGPWVTTTKTHAMYPHDAEDIYHPLNFDPSEAEILQLHFKVSDCTVTSTEDPRVVLVYHYMKDGVLKAKDYSMEGSYTYTEGEYVTVTIPTNSTFRSADAITTFGFRFWDLQGNGNGKVTIDYLYAGTVANAPTEESPMSEHLYVDFRDRETDRERYANDPMYLGTNFDTTGWTGGYYSASVGNIAHPLTVDTETHSANYLVTYRQNQKQAFKLVLPTANYPTQGAEVVLIKLRLENMKASGGADFVRLWYNNTYNSNAYYFAKDYVSDGEVVIIQTDLDEAFRKAGTATYLQVGIHNLIVNDTSKDGRIILDSVFIGKEEDISKIDSTYNHLWQTVYDGTEQDELQDYPDSPVVEPEQHPLKRAIKVAENEEGTKSGATRSGVSFTTPSNMTLNSKKDYSLAEGVEESTLTLTHNGNPLVVLATTVEPQAKATMKVSYASYYSQGSTQASREKLNGNLSHAKLKPTEHAANYESVTGNTVLFAMNGGFPNNSRATRGELIMEGNLIQTGLYNRKEPFFAVLKDGSFAILDYTDDYSNVEEALGARQWLVKDGKNVTSSLVEEDNLVNPTHPRTAIGIKADGSLVCVVVDGRQEGYSTLGVNLDDLAKLMLSLGCVRAVNLDGGGSSVFASRRSEGENLTIRNRPSDAAGERSVITALLLVSTEGDCEHDYSSQTYTVSKDGRHNLVCDLCRQGIDSPHRFTNGVCVCGKIEEVSANLFFDFTNTAADRERYQTYTYGYHNFDQGTNNDWWQGYWSGRATSPIARVDTGFRVMNESGMLRLEVCDGTGTSGTGTAEKPYEHNGSYGPWIMTANHFGERAAPNNASTLSLHYEPSQAEICQVRFRVDGCTEVVQSGYSGPRVVICYDHTTGGTTKRGEYDMVESYKYVDGEYVTLNFTLNEEFRNADEIRSFGFRFYDLYSTLPASDAGRGYVYIDYIYVGTVADAPVVDDCFFVDFTNTSNDRERYESHTYGGVNLDLAENWQANAFSTPVISDGVLSISRLDSTTDYGYINMGQSLVSKPLHYIPSEDDYFQIRLKIDDAVASNRYPSQTGNGRLVLYFSANPQSTNTLSFVHYDFKADTIVDKGWVTLTFKLSDMAYNTDQPKYSDYEVINAFTPCFNWLKSAEGKTASFHIDYIYVGPQEKLPSLNRPVYGYDSSYENDALLSNGSSLFTVGAGINEKDCRDYTQLAFDFVGTGFDIISRTGLQQATIRVEVYSDAKRTQRVKTMTVNQRGELELYQIPTVSIQGLSHNRYYVSIFVQKAISNAVVSFLNRGADFYFDAIRIYDPIDTSVSGTENVLNKYQKDYESYAYVKELRNILLDTNSFNGIQGSTEGAVYVDASSNLSSPNGTEIRINDHVVMTIADYNKAGPKNEVYLSPGQAVAFKLVIDSQQLPTSLDVGAKTISKTGAVLSAGFVKGGGLSSEPTGMKLKRSITTATSMYYPLPLTESVLTSGKDSNGNEIRYTYLVIRNDSSDLECILSLTDIKAAYDSKPSPYLPKDDVEDPEVQKKRTAEFVPLRFMVDGYTTEAIATYIREEIGNDPILVDVPIYHSLNLASDISVNYLVSVADMAEYDSFNMKIQFPVYEGNALKKYEAVILAPVENGEYYYFTLDGLTAVHMSNELEATLYMNKEGEAFVSETDHYSIAKYALSQMSKMESSGKLKTLCADLLRYGAAAQTYKGYHTDALADSAMSDAHRAYLSDVDNVTFGNTNQILNDLNNAPITWAGKSLNLDSKVALKFVFNPVNYQGDPSMLTLKASYTDISGELKTLSIGNPELYNPDMGLYVFTLDALLAAELRTVVSVQIFAGDIPVSCTLQYSADTYGNNKTGNLLELCKALFAYSDSAKAYFQ